MLAMNSPFGVPPQHKAANTLVEGALNGGRRKSGSRSLQDSRRINALDSKESSDGEKVDEMRSYRSPLRKAVQI